MQISNALLIALLSLSASKVVLGAPVQNGAAGSSSSNNLAARGMEKETLSSRSLAVHEGRRIVARYAHIASEQERSLAIVHDMSKRGILDTIVSAIEQVIMELLGVSSSLTKRQSTDSSIEQLICLLESLLGVSTSDCTASTTSTSTAAAAARRSAIALDSNLNLSSTASAQTSLAEALTQIGQMLEEQGEALSGNNSTSAAAAVASNATVTAAPSTATKAAKKKNKDHVVVERRELLTRQETEGVQGLLEVVRNLLDTVLNTLLPMSSRSESTTSTEAAWSRPTPENCPPAGAENLGQYIPGCPGYGRRDVAAIPILSARQTNSLQSLIPMLEMLMQQLPKLISSNTSSGIAGILSDIGASTTAVASPSKAAAVTSAATKSTPTSTSTGIKKAKTSAVSAAKLTINARDLLEADGFQKRQDGTTDSSASQSGNTGGLNVSILDDLLNGLLGGLLGTSSNSGSSLKADVGSTNSTASQDGNTGGLNVSILNDLLNGLLGGLLGTSTKRDVEQNGNTGGINIEVLNGLLNGLLGNNNHDHKRSTEQNGNKGGINVEVLNDLLNNLLGGNHINKRSTEQNGNKGGINIELLNGLLNNVLGGNHIKRAIFTMAARQVIQTRANFEPVWDEIKKIGNEKFHARNIVSDNHQQQEELVARSGGDFTPVWSTFRDMIDASFKEGKLHQKRSPFPKVDTSAFSHAAAQFIKQKVFAKRSTDFEPLKQATATFAKTQLKQWTDLIKSHKQ